MEEEERKRKEKEEKEEKKVKNEKNEKERVEKKRREKEEERRKKLNDVDLKRPARIKALRGTHVMVKVRRRQKIVPPPSPSLPHLAFLF